MTTIAFEDSSQSFENHESERTIFYSSRFENRKLILEPFFGDVAPPRRDKFSTLSRVDLRVVLRSRTGCDECASPTREEFIEIRVGDGSGIIDFETSISFDETVRVRDVDEIGLTCFRSKVGRIDRSDDVFR